jgi:hypothetical protein
MSLSLFLVCAVLFLAKQMISVIQRMSTSNTTQLVPFLCQSDRGVSDNKVTDSLSLDVLMI